MKQRDQRGRYKRVYRTASRWEVLTFYSVLGGMLLGLALDSVNQPHVFEVVRTVEAAEVVTVEEGPKEVMIEVVYTTEGIEQLIRETFVETPNTAVAVAKAESGHLLKADAYNPEWHYDSKGNAVCQGSYGVMQIACVHNIDNPEALFDVEFNIAKAKQIHASEGFSPWGGYTNGSWKKFLE